MLELKRFPPIQRITYEKSKISLSLSFLPWAIGFNGHADSGYWIFLELERILFLTLCRIKTSFTGLQCRWHGAVEAGVMQDPELNLYDVPKSQMNSFVLVTQLSNDVNGEHCLLCKIQRALRLTNSENPSLLLRPIPPLPRPGILL